jgi:crotonobetainyl-CoA:carnitine CoA-transferase CaiB-like acyl-CoA transferase
MSGAHVANYGLTGEERGRHGNYFKGVVPAEQFETADGAYIVINATTQRAFVKLCDAIGQPELVSDPRFTPRANLQANHEAIHAILAEWCRPRTYAELQATLDRYGVPATKVNLIGDIVSDPHVHAREQVLTVESHDYGPVLQPGITPRLTLTPGQVRAPAPKLGEHNEDIYLGMLGVDRTEYDRLVAEGVI